MTKTITKKDLVDRIAERSGLTKMVTKEIIQTFLAEIVSELGKGNRLEFREFGVFEIKQRAARRAQNPKTLHAVMVPPRKVVRFKEGRALRQALDRLDRLDRDAESRAGTADPQPSSVRSEEPPAS